MRSSSKRLGADSPRIGIVHADRPPGAVTLTIVDRVRDRGAEIDLLPVTGAVEITDMVPRCDLFVLKHSYGPALTLGAALHAGGAATLNPFPAVAACRDKAVAYTILIGAGLPVPRTYFLVEPEAASPLLADGPLVIKPNTGSKGTGVRVIRTAREFTEVDPADGPFIVQRFHPPEGLDRKLYRIGDAIHCVGRRWPASSLEAKIGVPLEVDPQLQRLTIAVGQALGIETYGVDVVISDGRPAVVDVSAFPGFKGVPDAGRLLGDWILTAAVSAARVGANR